MHSWKGSYLPPPPPPPPPGSSAAAVVADRSTERYTTARTGTCPAGDGCDVDAPWMEVVKSRRRRVRELDGVG
jgi:hypothetical protein